MLQIAGVRVLRARAALNKSIGNLFPQQQACRGPCRYDQVNTVSTGMLASTCLAVLFVPAFFVVFQGWSARKRVSPEAAADSAVPGHSL